MVTSQTNSFSVYLNIYDLNRKFNCLDFIGIGIYHTGVQLNEFQYCFSSTKTGNSNILRIRPQYARFQIRQKIYMGHINISVKQLNKILGTLSKKYTTETYHIYYWNCNHFSGQLIQILLNKDIPKKIFRTTNILKFICCCLPTLFNYINKRKKQRSKKQQEEIELTQLPLLKQKQQQ